MIDFKEKTITIDEILFSMRNINNLQIKPSISRALKQSSCLTQEPVSTRNATKRILEVLDAKYDKNCQKHLYTPEHITLQLATHIAPQI